MKDPWKAGVLSVLSTQAKLSRSAQPTFLLTLRKTFSWNNMMFYVSKLNFPQLFLLDFIVFMKTRIFEALNMHRKINPAFNKVFSANCKICKLCHFAPKK